MMTWTKINIGIAAVAIAAVGYQWHEASLANQRAAQLEQQLSQQTDLYNQQQTAFKQLRESNNALVKQMDSAPQSVASIPTTSRAVTSPAPSPGGAGVSKGFLAQMLKDPAMSKVLRDQQEQMLKTQFSPLAKQLKLTPEQTGQFFSILFNQQNANMTNGLNILAGGDQAAEAAKASKALESDTQSQLQALLGDDGYSQYKDYKDGLADKMLLDQMTPSFADNPLKPSQQQQLLQAMRSERQNATSIPGQAEATPDPTDLAGNMERAMQQQEQANQQVLQQAASFLSPDQLQALGNAQTNFLNMQKAGAAMAQSMFGGGSNSPAPQ